MKDPYVATALDAYVSSHDPAGLSYLGVPVSNQPEFWNNVRKRGYLAENYRGVHWCCRCGEVIPCHHINCDVVDDPAHAERIRARYAFGKLHNPDHDTAIYTDPPAADATA